MCRSNGETMDHLLLHCPKATVWNYEFHSFDVEWVQPGRVMDLLFAWWNWFRKNSSTV